MVANQPFTKFCFAREGHGVFLAAAVPPGKRAMSITLNDWSGMAGLLYPGSVVDVLVSFKTLGDEAANQRNDEMMSTTLLQGLQVMAIGSQSIADDEFKDKDPGALAQRGQINTRMVTLLVNPKQAEILQLAMNSGSISLAMRNPLDNGQESRRLTRAREISPDGGTPGIALTSEDPFADSKSNESRPAAAAAATVTSPATPAHANAWQTTIIRGKASETRTFPLPADTHGTAPDPIDPADATPKAELAPEPTPVGTGA
jgi:pilus assembly protein CpaB